MLTISQWQEKLDLCGRCGNCQQVCPLYKQFKTESVLARGKLYLINCLLEGKIEATNEVQEILDYCLLCGRCADLCQNGVPSDTLIVLGRAAVLEKKGRSIKGTLIKLLLEKNLLPPLMFALASAKRLGLKGGFNLLGKINSKAEKYHRLLPEVKAKQLIKQIPRNISGDKEKPTVGYFLGCMNNYISQRTGQATVNILQHLGHSVVVPEQGCCGMPAWTNGNLGIAENLIRANMEAFKKSSVDVIVTDCASCGHALKKLPPLFFGAEGEEFAQKIFDISEYLVEYLPTDLLIPLSKHVTYHDPCHMLCGQGLEQQPREVIGRLPNIQLTEMAEPGCCGFAGTFVIKHFETSNMLGQKRAQLVKETGAEVLVTSCPACQLQMQRMLNEQQIPVEVLNLVELVDKVLAGAKEGN